MQEYTEPLIDPKLLGAFPSEAVTEACHQVRLEAGWHIAPVITESVQIDAHGGTVLALPSLCVEEVQEVWDTTDPDRRRRLEGFRLNKAEGLLQRPGGLPRGVATVEVKMRHGFATCPASLLGVIRERIQLAGIHPGIRSESLASRSVQFGAVGATNTSGVLARYSLGPA